MTDCLASADTVVINDQACVLSVLQDITEQRHSEAELITAIEAVMQDTSWFSRAVIEKLADLRQPRGSTASRAELGDLTAREPEALALICRGLSDAAIAAQLGVSRNTVRNQVSAIYRKIDLHRRSAVVVWARERGFTGQEKRSERTRRLGRKKT